MGPAPKSHKSKITAITSNRSWPFEIRKNVADRQRTDTQRKKKPITEAPLMAVQIEHREQFKYLYMARGSGLEITYNRNTVQYNRILISIDNR